MDVLGQITIMEANIVHRSREQNYAARCIHKIVAFRAILTAQGLPCERVEYAARDNSTPFASFSCNLQGTYA